MPIVNVGSTPNGTVWGNIRVKVVTLTGPASYTSVGEDLSGSLPFKNTVGAIFGSGTRIPNFDPTTKVVKWYETPAGTTAAALSQVADATDLSGVKVTGIVLGF